MFEIILNNGIYTIQDEHIDIKVQTADKEIVSQIQNFLNLKTYDMIQDDQGNLVNIRNYLQEVLELTPKDELGNLIYVSYTTERNPNTGLITQVSLNVLGHKVGFTTSLVTRFYKCFDHLDIKAFVQPLGMDMIQFFDNDLYNEMLNGVCMFGDKAFIEDVMNSVPNA